MSDHYREQLGVWIKDRWRYERLLRSRSRRYLALTNRHERLQPAPQGDGFACCWKYTSRLHACSVQPSLGQRLIQRCLVDAPIHRKTAPEPFEGDPEVSVLIGHRGTDRLPLLQATLESVAAQKGVRLECLVIEQDNQIRIAGALPAWVRHVHAPLADPLAPYVRSQTFNVGAEHARGHVLVLHDNDMLVPCGYLKRILDRVENGYEVVNPKRFIFYLSKAHSQAVLQGQATFDAIAADYIVQNLEAGGSMAIRTETFKAIGGMDEAYVGWGGEDNEFWDRCLTRPTWIWGYEPIVHLWHASQPLKEQRDNPNLALARMAMALPPHERIEALRLKRSSGR